MITHCKCGRVMFQLNASEFACSCGKQAEVTSMRKLRLLLTSICHRQCVGCCNGDWDLQGLPIATNYRGYDQILLTGGEPMLFPEKIYKIVKDIRQQTTAPIFLYTAKVDDTQLSLAILDIVNGMTVTLHDQDDLTPFMRFALCIDYNKSKSLRLNVFAEVQMNLGFLIPYDAATVQSHWVIKDGVQWLDHCPLPDGEEFKRSSDSFIY